MAIRVLVDAAVFDSDLTAVVRGHFKVSRIKDLSVSPQLARFTKSAV